MTPNRFIRRMSIAGAALAVTLTVGLNAPDAAAAEPAGPHGPHAAGAGMSSDVSTASASIERSNEETAFDYFVAKGLTKVQAAGVVGNLDQESGMDPSISQIGGGPGRGIAQWGVSGRWDSYSKDNVVDYAAGKKASKYALKTQLDFTWYELSNYRYYGLSGLRSAKTISSAVTAFQNKYEGCGTCATGNRVKYAQDAYDRYA